MKLTDVPTVPVVGEVVKLTDIGVAGPIVMMLEVLASFPLVSVTFTLTVNVPLVA